MASPVAILRHRICLTSFDPSGIFMGMMKWLKTLFKRKSKEKFVRFRLPNGREFNVYYIDPKDV